MEHESAQSRLTCLAEFRENVCDVTRSHQTTSEIKKSITFNMDERDKSGYPSFSSFAGTCQSRPEFVNDESYKSQAWRGLSGIIDSISESVSETVDTVCRKVEDEMKRSVVYDFCRDLFVPSPALVPVVHQNSDVELSHLSTVSSLSNNSFEYERCASNMRTYSSPHGTPPPPTYFRSLGDDDERLENSPLRSDYSITRPSVYSVARLDITKTATSNKLVTPCIQPRREFVDDIDGTKVILTPSPWRNKSSSESPFMAELFRSDVEPFE
mmetsp:Transcript_18557/g.28053  ORF Transcript_18557/g.28053 Transcript_18557/m.28053 type:complete len:269 (+) Transcript_18557:36-842(+)